MSAALCEAAERPGDSQPCLNSQCQGAWVLGEWSQVHTPPRPSLPVTPLLSARPPVTAALGSAPCPASGSPAESPLTTSAPPWNRDPPPPSSASVLPAARTGARSPASRPGNPGTAGRRRPAGTPASSAASCGAPACAGPRGCGNSAAGPAAASRQHNLGPQYKQRSNGFGSQKLHNLEARLKPAMKVRTDG